MVKERSLSSFYLKSLSSESNTSIESNQDLLNLMNTYSRDIDKYYRYNLKLGEVLIRNNAINRKQLDEALEIQKKNTRKPYLHEIIVATGLVLPGNNGGFNSESGFLGNILLKAKQITREQLDEALQVQANQVYKQPLGDILISKGYIDRYRLEMVTDLLIKYYVDKKILTEEQLAWCFRQLANTVWRVHLGRILVDQGYISEERLSAEICRHAGTPYINLGKVKVPEDVLKLVKAKDAWRLKAIPVNAIGKVLNVAMVFPMNTMAVIEIEQNTGMKAHRLFTREKEFIDNFERIYRL